MALKPPLVLTSGKIEELQSADTILDTSPNVIEYTAGEDIDKREAVYLSAADTVMLAKADSPTTMPCIGIAEESKLNTEIIKIRVGGIITGVSGLIAKNEYYVDSTIAGQINNVAPSGAGDLVQAIGIAKSTTVLLVSLDQTVTIRE